MDPKQARSQKPKDGEGQMFQKSFATTWQTRFLPNFFSPLRGKCIFFKMTGGVHSPVPPAAYAPAVEV